MSARAWPRVALVLVTVACAWLSAARLRLSGDLTTLFPSTGESAALRTWTRAFGGHDPALVLVRGDRAEDVAAAADAMRAALSRAPSVERVLERAPALTGAPDPTLAWAFAGPAARARLGEILTPEGMRERLAETRALLLSPGASEAEAWLARDPLRLAQVPWESTAARRPGAELVSGAGVVPGALLVADEGRARLVLAQPRGSAFDSVAAKALVTDVAAGARAASRPGVTIELAGGHAISAAVEALLRRDLELSGAVSLALASVAFVGTFRRARALVAVLPPLVLGTLWTTGIAALLPSGLTAIAVAFAAVVVGVGVDTGVHVYAALLDARREGLVRSAAAAAARRATARPTLIAATVAAAAFASLGLSGLRAMRELGLLCGVGELLTAVAILLVTPEIGAWLERGAPPPRVSSPWVTALLAMTATRQRAALALGVSVAPLAMLVVLGWPRPADALVAIRPTGLAPLEAEQHVHALFGGSSEEWILLTRDADETRALARADRVAEALDGLARRGDIDGFDAPSTLEPAAATVSARLAERDALDLPARRGALEAALVEAGFDVAACGPALDAFAHPTSALAAIPADAQAWLRDRHVAREDGETLVATYVRPTVDPEARERVRAALARADVGTAVTSLGAIEGSLRAALSHDLLVVGAAALALVALGMRAALDSARLAGVAVATLACEMGAVGLAMRVLGVQWHVYDALVVPVLFGVTIDESMFLLAAAKEGTIADAMRAQAPLVAATALTTAAGFGALVVCRFAGLRDLGEVGAIGVLAGLGAALVVVPGALRVAGRP